jgi:hypothetical protein
MILHCRAQLTPGCYDGRAAPAEQISDDGTWDGETIICDDCYPRLLPFTKSNLGLFDELQDAIEHYQVNAKHVRDHLNLDELVAEASSVIEKSFPGSPRWRSSKACLAMVESERSRRGV